MTREERIKKLQSLITCMKCEVSGKCCDDNCPTQYDAGNIGEIIENLEEIAKALGQEPCDDCISREAVLDALHVEGRPTKRFDYVIEVRRDIKALPPVTPHPKTDTWSIKDVADTLAKHGLIVEQEPCENWYDVPSDEMTLGQARQAVKDLRKMWAEHLEQEPYGKDIDVPATDAISRQAAIDALESIGSLDTEADKKYARSVFEALQSVNTQPKTGHWIPVSERLPKEGEEVLVSGYDTYNKKVIIARYQGKQYGFTCGLVSAWMPLPKSYNAESEDKE